MLILALVAVVLAAAGSLYQLAGSRRAARACAMPGSAIDIGGRRLHVTTCGTGDPPVLLESGIAASSLSWAHVQPRVAEFARVCAYVVCEPA